MKVVNSEAGLEKAPEKGQEKEAFFFTLIAHLAQSLHFCSRSGGVTEIKHTLFLHMQ